MIDTFRAAMACHARRTTARKPCLVISLGLAAALPMFRIIFDLYEDTLERYLGNERRFISHAKTQQSPPQSA
jgi:hypothetical protein